MSGGLGVLNVGAGDTKLTFDKSNPAETIRSGRIVQDMLRRGYAILVQVPGKRGQKAGYARVHEFDPNTNEYIIADFDPVQAAAADEAERHAEDSVGAEASAGAESPARGQTVKPKPKRGRPATRRIAAAGTEGVAVARTAGG